MARFVIGLLVAVGVGLLVSVVQLVYGVYILCGRVTFPFC